MSKHVPEFADRPDVHNALPPAQTATFVHSSIPLTKEEFELVRAHRKAQEARQKVLSDAPIIEITNAIRSLQMSAQSDPDTIRRKIDTMYHAVSEFADSIQRYYGEKK